ncbi:peptidoglycan DD-metalloendopeptidase family protein [Rickettsiales bacterium]|nr:peptidoglycan DD-metalloendopeptidase family protein [Rickettsiales bacterium]
MKNKVYFMRLCLVGLVFVFFMSVCFLADNSHAGQIDSVPIPTLRNPQDNSGSPNSISITVNKGDTISDILQSVGIGMTEISAVIGELKNKFSPTSIKVGQRIKVNFEIKDRFGDEIGFKSLYISIGGSQEVGVKKIADNIFISEMVKKTLKPRLIYKEATISSTLFGASKEVGIPNSVMVDLVKNYSYDVDFQRDIRTGNEIKVLYEELYDEDGNFVDNGDVVFSNLKLNREEFDIYRYTTLDGDTYYYNGYGKSIRKSLLKTPVDGFRITSGYGKRRHPILGYNKMHKGIDFGAPHGTPIYAAGDGVIERLGRYGGYGKYIRINHKNGYSTAYAHMSRYGRNLTDGSKVKQGQIIGYVGSTGRSTGAHLHYEIMINGRHTNPLSIKTVSGRTLKGVEKGVFEQYKKQIVSIVDRNQSIRVVVNP